MSSVFCGIQRPLQRFEPSLQRLERPLKRPRQRLATDAPFNVRPV